MIRKHVAGFCCLLIGIVSIAPLFAQKQADAVNKRKEAKKFMDSWDLE